MVSCDATGDLNCPRSSKEADEGVLLQSSERLVGFDLGQRFVEVGLGRIGVARESVENGRIESVFVWVVIVWAQVE
jgi:hypothetical protein